jgi:hypothetical protein
MLKRIRLRLTYANLVATGAMFFALAGGTFALTGVPDRGGVFHGCVSNQTGVLRVVKSASSCRKARGRRHPGEFAVAWNQKGQPGAKGINGVKGINGAKGSTGPRGPTGVNGTNGATKVTVKKASGSPAKEGALSQVAVTCNPGEQVTGGGAEVDDDVIGAITASAPINGNQWVARAKNNATGAPTLTVTVTAFVICSP